ncbi:MAG TPA: hypothetical protein VJ697_07560 [Nitrososphaeraceae archaeon]|nr:hypothetical protein [Nitrososphaeraceae archaeon]
MNRISLLTYAFEDIVSTGNVLVLYTLAWMFHRTREVSFVVVVVPSPKYYRFYQNNYGKVIIVIIILFTTKLDGPAAAESGEF